MRDGTTFFSGVSEILGRRHRISDVNPESGTFTLHDADRAVRITLEPGLLAEYASRLDEQDIPDLPHSPQDAWDHVRTKYIALWIGEIFESDYRASLREVRLARTADGRIALDDRHGAPRRPFPAANADGNHWSPDRPFD